MSAGIIKNSKILLDKPAEFCYYNQAPRERHLAGQTEQHFHGGIAQLGERLNGIQEVSGSIPLISTKERKRLRNIPEPLFCLNCDAGRAPLDFAACKFEKV